jgi:allantoin racemase
VRIVFCNPFGTDAYDELVLGSLSPYVRPDTEVVVSHLQGVPRNIDYFLPKHLIETEIFRQVLAADEDGVDAFVVGCCYDPGVAVARELTDMPVVGPLEASVLLSRYVGHRFSVVTDHSKAAPALEDLIRVYGVDRNCRSVTVIDWYVEDMVRDPAAVARDAVSRCARVLEEDGSECVVLGCTIIAACIEREVLRGTVDLGGLPIVNPNVMAVKVAEMLADLRAVGQYRIARSGYYQRHDQRDPAEASEVRRVLGRGGPA